MANPEFDASVLLTSVPVGGVAGNGVSGGVVSGTDEPAAALSATELVPAVAPLPVGVVLVVPGGVKEVVSVAALGEGEGDGNGDALAELSTTGLGGFKVVSAGGGGAMAVHHKGQQKQNKTKIFPRKVLFMYLLLLPLYSWAYLTYVSLVKFSTRSNYTKRSHGIPDVSDPG